MRKQDHREMIFFFFNNPQNNIISNMPVLFCLAWKKIVMRRHFITLSSYYKLSTVIIYNFRDFIHLCGHGAGQIIPLGSNFERHKKLYYFYHQVVNFRKISLTYDFI